MDANDLVEVARDLCTVAAWFSAGGRPAGPLINQAAELLGGRAAQQWTQLPRGVVGAIS